MTNVKIGYGAQLWIANSSDVLTKVAELIEIGLPNPQVDEVEATHFESPDRAKEYIPGLTDNGEITFGINFVAGSATDTLITEAISSGEVREMEVVVPAGASSQTFAFSGMIKGYEKNIPINDRQTATITVRVNGAVTQSATETP